MSNHKLVQIQPRNLPASFEIFFSYQQIPQAWEFTFQVTSLENYQWNCSNNFSDNPLKNWGLWEFDVVELFWQVRSHGLADRPFPYYEFQISPNNMAFCLEVYRPRISYGTPLICPFSYHSKLTTTSKNTPQWTATFILSPSLSTPINDIALGAFAILGPQNNRQYFSLFDPGDLKPDFHQPKNFLPLSKLQ